ACRGGSASSSRRCAARARHTGKEAAEAQTPWFRDPPSEFVSLFPETSLRATGLPLVRPPGQAERHRGGDAHDLALDLDQLPSALVDHAVVALAEQDRVLEVGLAAVHPVHQVMAVA